MLPYTRKEAPVGYLILSPEHADALAHIQQCLAESGNEELVAEIRAIRIINVAGRSAVNQQDLEHFCAFIIDANTNAGKEVSAIRNEFLKIETAARVTEENLDTASHVSPHFQTMPKV